MNYINKMDFLASIVILELRTPSKIEKIKRFLEEVKGLIKYYGHYNKIYYHRNVRG